MSNHMEPLPITNPFELSPSEIDTRIKRLSPRQVEVISHLAEGLSNKQVAHALHLDTQTIVTHVRRAYKKIGVDNRIQLVVIWTLYNTRRVEIPDTQYVVCDPVSV